MTRSETRLRPGRFEALAASLGARLCLWAVEREAARVRDLPKCPDCGFAPDTGEECEVCREMAEQEARERSIYDAGFDGGWARAEERIGRGF